MHRQLKRLKRQVNLTRRRWQVALGPMNDEFWYFVKHHRLPEEDGR